MITAWRIAKQKYQIGQKWIEQAKHAVLKIPSTVIKEEHNLLINPAHPDFSAIEIGKPQRFES